MIPQIHTQERPDPLVRAYLSALEHSGFIGDIEGGYAARLLCATDNSVYQMLPQAVIFPACEQDVIHALRLRKTRRFEKLTITARGGGTGTNGQSLTSGICMDLSRHMRSVVSIDPQKREAVVQAGVIKDELNDLAKPHGLFFSPELSTSSRATIGGMISNDAAGQGSLRYGRTSSHVKSLRVVLADGMAVTLGPLSGQALETAAGEDDSHGRLVRRCREILRRAAPQAERIFPKLSRFMTGYDLVHAYDVASDTLHLHRLICGAEGTLGIVTEATLDLTPIPASRLLVCIKYADFDSALRHAGPLIAAGALSVETVDSRVLDLARRDAVWHQVREYIQDVPGATIAGLNIVEFAGSDPEAIHAAAAELMQQTAAAAKLRRGGILGAQEVSTAGGIAAVYGMRKKAVGLLGAAAGREKLVPFTEDTVVPPEQLADYIGEFRALLDSLGVTYGMFGHVDCGLMHVRPALDLTRDADREKFMTISEGVVRLTRKYGGQMWGEHGRGYRACFGETYFGELYQTVRDIKAVFDPDNILNPGKICLSAGTEGDLVALDGPMRADLDRRIPETVRENFAGALGCNGNGQCFSYQTSALMCPSYRHTLNRIRSPKGYSELMRDLLHELSAAGISVTGAEQEAVSRRAPFFRRLMNTLQDRGYLQEYLAHVSTCLSCKACKGICPAHVNAADLNSRFLNLYYGRYLRPLYDQVLLRAEVLLPRAAAWPGLFNALSCSLPGRIFTEKVLGLVNLPKFSRMTLADLCQRHALELLSTDEALDAAPDVLLVADIFTAAYEPQGLVTIGRLAGLMGLKAAVLRPAPCGKLAMIRGDRHGFLTAATAQAARLSALSHRDITLVGYDPALTLCYRDEYPQLLGGAAADFKVLLPEEWLTGEVLPKLQALPHASASADASAAANEAPGTEPYHLFIHCTEQALLPESAKLWLKVFAALGIPLECVSTACCGMAGLHGHMRCHLEQTRATFRQNWAPLLQKFSPGRCLVTGFSCRHQVHCQTGLKVVHPAEVIFRLLNCPPEAAAAQPDRGS